MASRIISGEPETERKPLRESDLVSVIQSGDPELLVPKKPAGMAETPSGIVVPEGHMATPSGILVQKRERHMCRYCGAVFGLEKGCELHESQCREQARNAWTASLLSGPASTGMTPEQAVQYITDTIKAHEKRQRTVWSEMGDPSA